MTEWYSQIPEEMRTEDKFLKMASHKGEDTTSETVQSIVEKITIGNLASTPNLLVSNEENYYRMIIHTYSNNYLIKALNTKHGTGSSEYIMRIFLYYSENNCSENN